MSTRDSRDPMERYRAGELSAAERESFEQEILGSDRLSDDLYEDVSLEHSLREASKRPARRITRLATVLVPLAAAALLIFAVQLRDPGAPEPPVMRGSGAEVELLAPSGELETLPTRFTWRAHPEAVRYRLVVLDVEADPRLRAVVADTTWVPGPEDVVPEAGSWHLTPLDDLMMDLAPASSATYRVVE